MKQRVTAWSRAGLLLASCTVALHGAEPIQYAGQKSEIVVSEVSERTVRVELLPLDEEGWARPATPYEPADALVVKMTH